MHVDHMQPARFQIDPYQKLIPGDYRVQRGGPLPGEDTTAARRPLPGSIGVQRIRSFARRITFRRRVVARPAFGGRPAFGATR